MTSQRQINVFAKPLLEKNPDVFLRKRLIVINPIRHVICGIYMDSSRSKNICRPFWFAALTFTHKMGLHGYEYTSLLFGGNLLDWDKPESVLRYQDLFHDELLPFLRGMSTVEGHEREIYDGRWVGWPSRLEPANRTDTRILRATALGRFDEAIEECDKLAKSEYMTRSLVLPIYPHILEELFPALKRGDKSEIAAVLHAWEEDTVRNREVENLYERTPFPFEEA